MAGEEQEKKNRREFSSTVDRKTARRLKARRSRNRGVYFGMGMFGMVGWTIAVYTLLGVALGVWIDGRWPGGYSWTLTLLLLGLGAGLYNAWYWVQKELEDSGDDDETP
jgi:ATP synthase protein I